MDRSRISSGACLIGLVLLGLAMNSECVASPKLEAIKLSDCPVIDGEIDEELFDAPHITLGEFVLIGADAVDSRPHMAGWVAAGYCDDGLYFAVCCSKRDEEIFASTLRRDQLTLGTHEDGVFLFLDSSRDRRNAFVFGVNPFNVQADATIVAEGDLAYEWDAEWYSAVNRDTEQLTYEILIPWRSVSFRAGIDTVGINVVLTSRTPREIASWARCYRSLSEVSSFNDLVLAHPVEPRLVVNVRPQVRVRREDAGGAGTTSIAEGADLLIRGRGGGGGVITIHPDFAEAEPDADEIILEKEMQRYLPEKRVFFQSGLDLLQSDVFYSRRIEEIDYGMKMQGQLETVDYAVLGWKGTSTSGSLNGLFGATAFGIGESTNGQLIGGIYRISDQSHGTVQFSFKTKPTAAMEITAKLSTHTESDRVLDEAGAYEVAAVYSRQSTSGMLRYRHVGIRAEPSIGFFSETGLRGVDGSVQKSGRIAGRASTMWSVVASGGYFLGERGERYKSGGSVSFSLYPSDKAFLWLAAEHISVVFGGFDYTRRTVRVYLSYGKSMGLSIGTIVGESFGDPVRMYGAGVFASLGDRLSVDLNSMFEGGQYSGDSGVTVLVVSHLTWRPSDWAMVRAFLQYSDLSNSFLANGVITFEPGNWKIVLAVNDMRPISSSTDGLQGRTNILALKLSYDLPIR